MNVTPEQPRDQRSAAAPEDGGDSRGPRQQRWLSVLLSCCAFFASYVITAGPAVFIVRRLDLPMIGAIVERLYAPLILIIKLKVPLLAPLIKAWVDLFR